jgi:serine-type D-Ala-D-Ala carboxypeptidase/endopeptidase
MRKHNVYAIVLSVFVFSSQVLFSQSGNSKLDDLVKNLGENFLTQKGGIGLSIGIYRNRESYFYNFGITQKGTTQKPSKNTIYEIGSITKTFVSFVLVNAVFEHKLSLDDDIRNYLKEEYPNLEYRGHPIKIVHLANTTSLLPDWLPELPAKAINGDSLSKSSKIHAKSVFLKALHSVKLDTIPGTRAKHSNTAAQLLGYILENIYNMPIDSLIERYVTKPNKMNNTLFIHSNQIKNLASGYTPTDKKANYEFMSPYYPYAGSLVSTTDNLVKYLKLFLDKTNKFSFLCLQKTIDIDASKGTIVETRPDTIATPDIYSIALNWFKYQPEISSSQIWTDGGTNGFNSYIVIYPYFNSGVVVLANKSDEKIFRSLPGIAFEISKVINQN